MIKFILWYFRPYTPANWLIKVHFPRTNCTLLIYLKLSRNLVVSSPYWQVYFFIFRYLHEQSITLLHLYIVEIWQPPGCVCFGLKKVHSQKVLGKIFFSPLLLQIPINSILWHRDGAAAARRILRTSENRL